MIATEAASQVRFTSVAAAEAAAAQVWEWEPPAWAATYTIPGGCGVCEAEPAQTPGGRYFEFPGRLALERLERTTVGWALEHTAIEAVLDPDGVALRPGELLLPRGQVRPIARNGVLTLPVCAVGEDLWACCEHSDG